MERRSQDRGLLDPTKTNLGIGIIGAGSLGSWLTLFLVKMGFTNICVWDDDKIELHNADNQLYGETYAGMLKVDALQRICLQLGSKTPIRYVRHKWTPARPELEYDILIPAVDTITVRKDLWEIYKYKTGDHYVVDPRMGGEVFSIYTTKVMDASTHPTYEAMLFPQEESAEIACTERSILYTPAVCAGMIADHVKKIVMGQPYKPSLTYHMRTYQLVFL